MDELYYNDDGSISFGYSKSYDGCPFDPYDPQEEGIYDDETYYCAETDPLIIEDYSTWTGDRW